MNNIIFINADDFGLDDKTNEKIKYCLSNNLISSTTLIANMPGFNNAVDLIYKYNFHGRVGIHLNLVDGYSLSEEMKDFMDGEKLHKFRILYLSHFYSERARHAIYHELRAQMIRILNLGVIPTHIDTHAHVHHYFDILRIIHKLAEEYNIGYIRNTRNLFIKRSYRNIVFKKLYYMYRRYQKIHGSIYFTSLSSYIAHNCKLLNTELMCHPGHTNEFAFLCSNTYAKFIKQRQDDIAFEPFFLNVETQ